MDSGTGYTNEVMHTSYFISICMCLAMVCSFRVKLFNTTAIALFLVCFFSFPTWDIPNWINDPIGSMLWWNAVTIHTPILIIAIYMISARKVLISKECFFISIFLLAGWFFTVDDKQNGTVFSGTNYIIVAGIALVIWSIFSWFTILKDVPERCRSYDCTSNSDNWFYLQNQKSNINRSEYRKPT